LDLHPRVRDAARLAFAIGMSDGEALLQEIAKRSRHRVVRQLADRFHRQLIANSTIHAEYRSPARSIHQVGDSEVVIDTGSVFNNVESMESILSYLALENDQKTQARLKQLDAYFYGTGIR
jgi:hypothetical protein